MGKENLIPANKRSQAEASELGRKGGIKSGEVRRMKRDFKKRLQMGIDTITKNAKTEAIKQKKKDVADTIDEIGYEVYSLLEIATSKKIKAELRLKALTDIIDRLHGKPTQKNEIVGLDDGAIQNEMIVTFVKATKDELKD